MTSLPLTRIERTPSLLPTGPVGVERIEKDDANLLLNRWGHQLGACNRPFGQDHWMLRVGCQPVAVAVTASLVSPAITDENGTVWPRNEAVELARIARHPDQPWTLRVMLRLWREVLAHEWAHWSPKIAVSYALPGRTGDLYRFDGWTRIREVKRSAPGAGSTWSKPSASDEVGDGRKTLWVYRWGDHQYLHADGRIATEQEAIDDGGSWLGMHRLGKKKAGRELDRRTWDEFPAGGPHTAGKAHDHHQEAT